MQDTSLLKTTQENNMFFILSKILLFLTKPFIWILVLFVTGYFFKKWKYAKKALGLSLIFLFFFSNSVIQLEFSRLWEVQGKKIETLGTYDCALVLTGMASYNNDLNRLELNRNGDRIWQAMDLYRSGKVKKIMISGDSGHLTDKGLHEAQQLAMVLERNGIPTEDVIVESKSQNTYQNALESAKIIKTKHKNWKKILLVTSSTHMRRSMACFKKQGIICTPFSTNLDTGPTRGYFFEQYLLPNIGALEAWENITKEWAGFVMYKLMGYL